MLSGTDLPVINCLVEVGAASQWALPSGGQTLLEGNNVTLLPDHNESATLFGPPQIAGGQLIMINNQRQNMNKNQIKKAVEEAFDVKVKKVNTVNVKSKPKRQGFTRGRTSTWKKAVVKLAEGDRIELFEGV